ncbi:dynein regulatory complex subunit 4 [Diabrotica virgifera virgifera]|uniref:Dynein regulatory complex subunit 4 n=2 Tax=Diabrotica virgifera virgifera TaxID=50390 RepID=A0ABM5JTQ0_DIAVI|nr:dynein regulatory complex subunit 4 [Diabrotica virgifera virgifera]
MPPKKGGGPKIIDGVDTTSMTREQLEAFAQRIKEENDREREERNFFQMERDKIRTFWEITRNELEEARAQVRNKDRALEEGVEKNEEELKFFKQKVKHLQYEHQNNLTECKAESLVALKQAQDEHTVQERQLLEDKKNLKAQMREKELSNQEQIKSLKIQNSEEISKARSEFEIRAKEMEMKYEKKYADLRAHLNNKHDMEISEVEERKNEHISNLIKHHEKAFNEMKNYYNDITLNNLALISSLKDQMEILRKQNERMTKQVADLTAENKRLVNPLNAALAQIKEYKRQLENYERDKQALANTKLMLSQKIKALDDLRWSYDALELRFETLQKERDELHNRFVQAVLEVQQKTSVKNLLLNKRISTLTQVAEHREIVIAELQAATKTPPQRTNQKLEEILTKKNATISDLQYELARVCKAHDDLLETFEEKLQQYGIPKQELGFIPLRIIPEGQGGLATGPAGLVTENR